ncbi:hypothetical protein MJ904_11440 [Massilia sp. MB5]|uniref:hypothetical protein n=1 Tax=unclassified Massilia TaxID=2609279 RepID=UPI00067C3744|nr:MULTISPECIES: hypothetical protein [unclassified Massilia]AKU22499.1 hypothetical protein ACZ75_14485 [Massilia sp. NR 4-1]UMR32716.1 hypothetical protein MJ904_11440 [Massilia sp. MB5]
MLKKIAFIFALGLSASYAMAAGSCEGQCAEKFAFCNAHGKPPGLCSMEYRNCIDRCDFGV